MRDGAEGGRGPSGVLCVGRIYCDLVFTGLPAAPAPGREVFADALALSAGGGAAISAAWLAALGRPAALCGHLPAAPFDAVVRADMAAAGVDLSACAPAAGREPQITVAMMTQGDRAFLTRAPGAAAPPLDADGLRALGAHHLHVGELRTLIERPDLVTAARAAGVTLSCDCAWDDGVTAACAPLIAALDLFLPNAEEAARLAALGVPFAALTVEKRGAAGAVAHTARGTVERPAPAVEVVDTTGAGDAFAAGFLDRWLDGAPLGAALEAGIACGSRAVTRAGGIAAARAVPTA